MDTYCHATLNYASLIGASPTEVAILNGRQASGLGWEENGFELVEHATALDAFDDLDADSPHYDEIGQLARELTGCDATLYYPALVRSPETAARSADLAPIEFVHSDYTETYRGMICDAAHPYRAILSPFMERAGLSHDDLVAATRVVTLQFWRNVGPPRMRHPLAFCDARTVDRSELWPLLVAEYGGIETKFESFAVSPPEVAGAHRWMTFPEMTRDEVVVFRAYDSARAEAGEPFWTPHCAFLDPNAGEDAPPRVSLEMRAVCLFLR